MNSSPELTGVGKYFGEMSSWLAEQGHEVKIITAPPYYPEWRVARGFSCWRWTKEKNDRLITWRCPVWVPKNVNAIKRVVHQISYILSSFPIMCAQIFWRPDLVITVQPPLLLSPISLFVARLTNAKSLLHIQDYELDAALGLGIIRDSLIMKAIVYLERKLILRFDFVSTISQKMLKKAIDKGVDPKKLVFFPNWVDCTSFNKTIETVRSRDYRELLKIPTDAIVVMYSGNMGEKQGVESLGDVALHILSRADIKSEVHFIFCGDGNRRYQLFELCKRNEKIHFLDLQPLENLPDLLSSADLHLLPQKAEIVDFVMPSKLSGMLASRRPTVAMATSGSEVDDVLKDCGIVVPPGDLPAFINAILLLISDKKMRTRLGDNARKFAIQHIDKERVLSDFSQNVISKCG